MAHPATGMVRLFSRIISTKRSAHVPLCIHCMSPHSFLILLYICGLASLYHRLRAPGYLYTIQAIMCGRCAENFAYLNVCVSRGSTEREYSAVDAHAQKPSRAKMVEMRSRAPRYSLSQVNVGHCTRELSMKYT